MLEFINPVLGWLILGAIFLVGELFVSTFFLLSWGLAALVTALGVYLFLPNTLSQCGVFVVVTALLLLIFRKRLRG